MLASGGYAHASHIDWDARRAEREAARVEREAEREARRLEREAEDETEEVATCSCSAGLSFDRPQLQFSGGTLSFIPRVNVDLRSHGESSAPAFTVNLNYTGSSSYTSDDITPPAGVAFSGNKTVVSNALCGSTYSFGGLALSPVSLTGLSRGLVEEDQKLAGTIRLQADLAGCSEETEQRQFGFTLRQFGNLVVNGWRSLR